MTPPLFQGALAPGEAFDFSMCNPPFFGEAVEAGGNPRTELGGTAAEMVTEGGEAAFVARMVRPRMPYAVCVVLAGRGARPPSSRAWRGPFFFLY